MVWRNVFTSESYSIDASMKIASFNINNVNRRLANLIDWLRDSAPDVVCLQELKAADSEFPAKALREIGYEAAWRGQKSWNGVAILARTAPIVTRTELPGDAADKQSRYLEAAVNGVLVASLYAPNGNPHLGPKFDYKLAWMERLIAHAAELHATGAPVALAGDFNVVPTVRDIYKTKSWDRDALLQPEAAPRTDGSWPRVGRTPFARFGRTSRCSRSGITSSTAGSATAAFASTTSLSVPV